MRGMGWEEDCGGTEERGKREHLVEIAKWGNGEKLVSYTVLSPHPRRGNGEKLVS